jgi:prophage regulatory protein
MSHVAFSYGRLFSIKELPSLGITYSRFHLSRLTREGKFPQPIRLSANRIAWLESELQNWIRERAAGRKV